jgi:hypothetical protein
MTIALWLGFFAFFRFLPPFFPERRVAAPLPLPPRRPPPARAEPPLPDRAEPPGPERPDPDANVPLRPFPLPPPALFRVLAPVLPRELPLPRDSPAPLRFAAGLAPPGGTSGRMISTGSSW